jgi:hypothetical protein
MAGLSMSAAHPAIITSSKASTVGTARAIVPPPHLRTQEGRLQGVLSGVGPRITAR